MFRFIHTADIHLDSPLKGLAVYEDAPVGDIRRATRRAFDNLINLAIDEKVAFVLISGDLYDGDWKDYNTGLFFADRMGRLEKAGIKVFIVSGNHDAASQITKAMPLPDNVFLFPEADPHSVVIEGLGVALHGQSYRSRVVDENIASRYPSAIPGYFNIGLLHTALTGRPGHEPYAPCRVDDLLSKGYDYWGLGHVHTRELLSRDPCIIFPGNIQGRHIRETGPKGVTLISVEDGRMSAIEERIMDVLRWGVCRADLSDCETRDDVYQCIRTAMEGARRQAEGRILALRLLLEGASPMHAELHAGFGRWTEEIRGIAAGLGDVWLEKIKVGTSRKISLEEIVGDDTPLGGLLQAIENLDFGNGEISSLLPEFAGLMTKLPPGILDSESVLYNSAARQSELLEEVRELLVAKLLLHGDGA